MGSFALQLGVLGFALRHPARIDSSLGHHRRSFFLYSSLRYEDGGYDTSPTLPYSLPSILPLLIMNSSMVSLPFVLSFFALFLQVREWRDHSSSLIRIAFSTLLCWVVRPSFTLPHHAPSLFPLSLHLFGKGVLLSVIYLYYSYSFENL